MNDSVNVIVVRLSLTADGCSMSPSRDGDWQNSRPESDSGRFEELRRIYDVRASSSTLSRPKRRTASHAQPQSQHSRALRRRRDSLGDAADKLGHLSVRK